MRTNVSGDAESAWPDCAYLPYIVSLKLDSRLAIHLRYTLLIETRGLYDDMTLLDTLLFMGQLKGLDRQSARQRAERYLKEIELWEVRKRKREALSRGMRQKAQFVAGTMHEPDLIISLFVSIWFVARIFRAAMLMYGQSLRPHQIWQALRGAW